MVVDELTNPFRPGAGSPPPALIGRDALIDRFGVIIRRALAGLPGKSLMPIGLRGVGKTVLLNRFAEIAEQEGFSVGFIEAPEHGDLRVTLAGRLRRILLRLERSGTGERLIRAMRILKTFSAQLPDGTRLTLDVDALRGFADSGDLSEDLTDLLEAVGEAAAERGAGILLAIDEVQYVSEAELGAVISAIHRTTQRGLPVVLVGAGLPQLPTLTGVAKSYAERLFEFPTLGSLAPEDARAAILIPCQRGGLDLTDGALEEIVAATDGYPYFLQEWGYHVWNAAQRSPVTREDVRAIRAEVIRHLDHSFFLVRFERLTPREKQYLRAMAQLGPGPHRSGDIAARLGARVESVAPRRADLIAKGVLFSPAYGETAFTVPLFDDFLRRTEPR